MSKKVYFISATFNASSHLGDLYDSLLEQTDEDWNWVIINDMSEDNTLDIAKSIEKSDKLKRVVVLNNKEKKFKVKSVFEYLHSLSGLVDVKETIIVMIDGDDCLCNENTVSLLKREYEKNENLDAVWTAHSWDVNGMNTSGEMPDSVNPYQYPWVSSHLKTFKLENFIKIKKENFKKLNGDWIKIGCDQAIYLPILYLAKERKFIDEVCYLYRVNSNSIKQRGSGKEQINSVKLLRSRGYVK